mmetsp:Transcript_23277/g.54073  ORF Transcript_23277/g.54073 Transcript_23277/m.54073 type:complete len:242 (+) Transcript_23277:288-1013(+)
MPPASFLMQPASGLVPHGLRHCCRCTSSGGCGSASRSHGSQTDICTLSRQWLVSDFTPCFPRPSSSSIGHGRGQSRGQGLFPGGETFILRYRAWCLESSDLLSLPSHSTSHIATWPPSNGEQMAGTTSSLDTGSLPTCQAALTTPLKCFCMPPSSLSMVVPRVPGWRCVLSRVTLLFRRCARTNGTTRGLVQPSRRQGQYSQESRILGPSSSFSRASEARAPERFACGSPSTRPHPVQVPC